MILIARPFPLRGLEVTTGLSLVSISALGSEEPPSMDFIPWRYALISVSVWNVLTMVPLEGSYLLPQDLHVVVPTGTCRPWSLLQEGHLEMANTGREWTPFR
jgi:hypothetical protein